VFSHCDNGVETMQLRCWRLALTHFKALVAIGHVLAQSGDSDSPMVAVLASAPDYSAATTGVEHGVLEKR